MSRVTTPEDITPQILELCHSISRCEPVYVPVTVDPLSHNNECYQNVETYVGNHGGQRILGRCIWQRANIMIEAMAHAVWKSQTGDLFDITPHDGEHRILFVADPQLLYDGNRIPSIRKALTSSPLVAEYISLYDERDQIAAETKEENFIIPFKMHRRMEEIDQIFNHRVGRNDPCPCQSDKKYKKCCGIYER